MAHTGGGVLISCLSTQESPDLFIYTVTFPALPPLLTSGSQSDIIKYTAGKKSTELALPG